MIKALLKKELLQFLSIYTFSRKTGKQRAVGASVLLLGALALAFISISVMFFGMYMLLGEAIAETEARWLLFALSGGLTLTMGVLGSVFTTYSVLYKAKDNELLLSMPIPSRTILFVRILTVVVMNLISCLIPWAPSLIAYILCMGFSPAVLVSHALMALALTAFATVVTSVLGWLVALVSRHIKNKSLVTVVLSLVFMAGYYIIYFRMNSIIRAVITNLDKVEAAMHGWGWPLMQIGRAASGELLPLAVTVLAVAALFALMYFVLSRTLFAVITATAKTRKAVYHEKRAKRASVNAALLRREFKRFLSSPTLLLNSGLGVILVIAGAAAAIIKADALRGFIEGIGLPEFMLKGLPALPLAAVSLILSMDCFTASTVSLEGRSISLIQAMPVPAVRVLRMKELTHILINGIPGVIASIALGIVVRSSPLETALTAVCSAVFVWLTAAFGLMMNLIKPNLEWTNESVPVKQGLPVLFALLFGTGLAFIFAGAAVGIGMFTGPVPVIAASGAIWAVAALLIDLWIKKKGAEKFSHLT